MMFSDAIEGREIRSEDGLSAETVICFVLILYTTSSSTRNSKDGAQWPHDVCRDLFKRWLSTINFPVGPLTPITVCRILYNLPNALSSTASPGLLLTSIE